MSCEYAKLKRTKSFVLRTRIWANLRIGRYLKLRKDGLAGLYIRYDH